MKGLRADLIVIDEAVEFSVPLNYALGVPKVVVDLLVAARAAADCSRRKVGCVVTNVRGHVVSVGWNGLRNGGSCGKQQDCPRGRMSYETVPAFSSYANNCEALHAEDSALMAAGTRAEGGTIWITCQPCPDCEILIEESRVAHVEVVNLPE